MNADGWPGVELTAMLNVLDWPAPQPLFAVTLNVPAVALAAKFILAVLLLSLIAAPVPLYAHVYEVAPLTEGTV